MGWLFAYEQIPQKVAGAMLILTTNKYLSYAVNGVPDCHWVCAEGIPDMLITLPFLLPLADQFGIDRVHFGMIMVYGLLIGIVTPPMGIALYIMVEVSKVSFENIVVAVLPFLIPLIVVFFMITFIPVSITYIPVLLMGAD